MKRHYYLILSLVALLCSQTTFSQNCDQIGEIVPFETFAPACDLNYAIITLVDNQLLTNIELPTQYQIGDIIKIGDIVAAYTAPCEFTGEDVTYYQANCVEQAACAESLLADMFVTVDCIDVYEPVCGCDGQTYANVCNAQAEGITSFVAGECGSNGVFCGVEEAWAIPWLQFYINSPCYSQIYSFQFNGQAAIFVEANSTCTDVPSVLFDCQGYVTCESGGFIPANQQCSSQGINLEPFLIPGNLVWFDDPACCDPLPEVCGVIEIWELEWLNELTDNSNGCAIMTINQFEYNGATYFQGIPNFGSNSCPTDLPTVFYDCEGSIFCSAGFGGSNCPSNLFEAANNGFTVWEYIPEPCFCPAVFDPVCGVDGVTYGNACEADCAGVPIAYNGPCAPTLACGVEDIWELEWLNELIATSDPCDVYKIEQFFSDGNFYFETIPQIPDGNSNCPIDNSYIFYDCEGNIVCTEGSELGSDCDFSNGTTGHQIVWEYIPEPCFCPAVFEPVCGVDGVTYGNACQAACEGVAIAYEGFCELPLVCDVQEIWELEWLDELITNADGCSVEHINQFEYNGATYFQAIPNPGSMTCPADLPILFYDCEGNIFCSSGFGGTNCPPNLFEAANNGFTVWVYESPMPPNDCEANPLFTYTITGSIGTDDVPQSYGANIYCFNDNIFTDNICGWEWDFGNGETSTESDPCDVFLPYLENAQLITTPYEVCLTVYECGSNTATTCCQEVSPLPMPINECICPAVVLPVCGIDGNTYNNECEALCAGVPVLYDGSCEEPNDLNMCEVDIKMFLQGALFNTTDGLMRDDLRTNNVLPLTEPYTNSPYFTHVGGGGETTTPAVFNVAGQNAITDWVFLELRDAANNLVKTRSALLQRDGDVVEVDGVSPVNFDVSDGSYYVCVRHRNHLGTMTNNLMNISSNAMTTIDFTNISTYGTDAQMAWNNNVNALWAGHTNNTGSISFQGFDNNINGLFFEVLSAPNNPSNVANYIYDGYNEGDINMDGSTIYQGNNSDVTNIFFTTLQHPQNNNNIANFVIYQQMP